MEVFIRVDRSEVREIVNDYIKDYSMAKDHGNQIKDDAKYEALRRQGASKEKAARIANSPQASVNGGRASNLEDRTRAELLETAKKIGIVGRYKLRKNELIEKIRNH